MRQKIPVCLAAVAMSVGLLFLFTPSAFCQGNSISGGVFGADRRPVSDVYVELRDEFSRTLQRGRTNSGGRFSFTGLASGRFKVAVLPYELPYEEQEHEVEIVNFSRPSGNGSFPTGFSSEVVDVYLKLKR